MRQYTIYEDGNMKTENFAPVTPRNNGFSLVELIIVIAIIAILAAAIAPALIRYINKSRKATDVDTADVLLDAVNAAYAEDYSFEGTVNGHQQDANIVDTSKVVSVTVDNEAAYDLEKIAVAKNNDTFVNTFDPQQHFLGLVRQTIGKEQSGTIDFSTPRCKVNSGKGIPSGFLIGRQLNGNATIRFEVWLVDDSDTPLYRLQPVCCSEYK